MKARLFMLFAGLLFSACSNLSVGSENATATPDFVATDTASQIGTAIAARATEVAIEALYTPTPTPGEASLKDLTLTSAEANELADRWSSSPADDTANINPEYCAVECSSLIWEGGVNGFSTLEITLIKTGSRDGAVTILGELKAAYVSQASPEIPLTELVTLPEETVAFRGQTDENTLIWGMVTRQGSVVVLIELYMPDLGEEENILFLSLYAERQIQKLMAAGY